MAVIDESVVRIEPDFSGFHRRYRNALNSLARPRNVDVGVTVDRQQVDRTRAMVARQMRDIGEIGSNALMQGAARLQAQRDRAEQQRCRESLARTRTCEEARQHLVRVAEQRAYRERAQRDREFNDQLVRQARDAGDRRGRALAAALGAVGQAGAGGGIIDLGRRGIRPINALITAAIAASPAVLALGSSAVTASTSLAAMGGAAIGTASAIGVTTFALSGMGDALKWTEQAEQGNQASAEKLEEALAGMSRAGRDFYATLQDIRSEMGGFAQLAQSVVLPGFDAFLTAIRDTTRGPSTMDVLKVGMLDLGAVIADTSARAGEFAASDMFKARLASITDRNTQAFQSLNDAAVALLDPITRLVERSMPQLTRFADWMERTAGDFADWMDSFTGTQLADWFARAGDAMARWGDVAGNTLGVLRGLYAASEPAGQTLLDRLADWTANINDFVNSAAGQRQLERFFEFVASIPYGDIAQGLGVVVGGFLALKAALAVGGAAGGLIGWFRALATGNVAAAGIQALGAALFGLGAAATYAYMHFPEFREAANTTLAGLREDAAQLAEVYLPQLEYGLRQVASAMADASGETGALISLMTDWLTSPAVQVFISPAGGATLAASQIRHLGLLMRAFWNVAEAAAGAARFIQEAFQAVGNAVLNTVRTIGESALSVLRYANPIAAAGLEKALGGLDAYQQRMNDVADDIQARTDDLAEHIAGRLSQATYDAANRAEQARSTYESQVPAAARQHAETTRDATAAQERLNEALAAQAAQAQRSAQEMTALGRAVADAREQVRQAQLGIVAAQQAVRDAQWGIADAHAAIAAGHREAAQAQRDLSAARRQAAQDLRALRLEVRGLAVDEEEARLNLAVSREVLKSFEYSASVDPLFRRGLRLEVAKDEQTLNETLENGRLKRAELAAAERAGVDGSERVRQARQRLAEVTDANLKRERDLIRAHEQLRRAEADLTTAHYRARTASDELRAATDRRARASNDAREAAAKEATAVEQARRKYQQLKDQIDKVPASKSTRYKVYPEVTLTKEYLAKRQALTLSVYESQVPAAARAHGGLVGGVGGPTADNQLIWASPREFVQPAVAVDYYGPEFMEAVRRRLIPREAIDLHGRDRPAYAEGGYVWPTPGYRGITSPYGAFRGSYYHGGTDIGAPTGARIAAAAAGRVIQSGWYGGGGNTVSLAHAGNLVTRYMHMLRTLARVGQAVAAGQTIGLVDNTGDSSGPHLHFQAERPSGRTIDPMGLIRGAPTVGAIPAAPGAPRWAIPDAYRVATAVISAAQYANQQAAAWYNTLGANVRAEPLTEVFRVPAEVFDTGGTLRPGATLALNRTGRAETVRTSEQEAALDGPMRIDRRDLRLLAAYIAQATDRPIDMDGRRVAEAVHAHDYLPAGV